MNDQPKPTKLRSQLITILTVTSWAIMTFVIAYLVTGVVVDGLVALSPDLFGLSQNVVVVVISVFVYLLMLALLLFLPRIIKKRPPTLAILGLWRSLEWKDIGLALPAIVIYFISTAATLYLATKFLPWMDAAQAQETGLSSITVGSELLWIFMLLVVVGPFVEEVIFRGYLYGKIRVARVPFWLTAIIVSLLFGLAHMQWNVGIDTFVLSMVMCLARELTGSIWTGVLMHMAKNGLAFYFLFIATSTLPAASMLPI